jgi:hypothetical protein
MMAIHYAGVDSAPPIKGLNMKKLIAAIFLAFLGAGSISGCVVDDGHRGGPPGHMENHGEGPRDRNDHGDDHRDRDDDHRDHH